jgi:uncharacterized protein YndB with AHSA1/START domain
MAETPTTGPTDVVDRIERRIDIAAPAQRVWDLVSTPGWYINDGTIVDHRIDRTGDIDVVHDPVHGPFRIRTVELDPPRYAAFRWLADEPGPDGGEASTLVEFWLNEHPDGVTLRVAESGFASLGGTDEARRRRVAENTEGWEQELAAARRHLAAGVSEPAR